MVETGITEEIELQEKSGGSEVLTDKLGLIQSATHTVSQSVETVASVGQGAQPQANVDGVAQIEGGVTCNPSNLEILELFGTFTDNGDGTYTVSPDDTLPSFTFKQLKVSGGGTAILDGFKFGSFSLSAENEGRLELTADGQGTSFKFDDSETITTESPETDVRKFFDAQVSIDGSTVGSVESFTVDFNRDLEAFKGIEDDAAGEKRTPTEIVEKIFDLSFDIVINIENGRAYEEGLGDSSSPYEVQDDRSNVDITITVETSAGSDEFKVFDALAEEVSAEQNNEGEVLTDRKANNNRDAEAAVSAETSVSTSQFQEVTSYLYKRMISKYNRGDDVDIDKLTSKSQKEIARYYFDQLQVFPSQQKKTG